MVVLYHKMKLYNKCKCCVRHRRSLLFLSILLGLDCQEAFNRRLPVCCFGSVRNPLVLINS